MNRTSIYCVISLTLLTSWSSLAFAQTTDSSTQIAGSAATAMSKPPRPRNPEASKRAKLTRLKKTIDLTAEQESKAKPTISTYVENVNAVRQDASLQPKERRQKLSALRKQYDADLNALLTDEQRQKLASIKAERLAKLRAARAARASSPDTATAQ